MSPLDLRLPSSPSRRPPRMNDTVPPLASIAALPIDADEPMASLTAPLLAQGTLLHVDSDRLVGSDSASGTRRWSAAWSSKAAQQVEWLTVSEHPAVLYATGENPQYVRALSLEDGTARWATRLPEGHEFAEHNRYAQTETLLYAVVERTRPYRQSALMALDKQSGERVRSAATTATTQDLCIGGGHLLVLESLPDLRPGYSSTVVVARDPQTLVTRWRMVVSGRGATDGGRIVARGHLAWLGSTSGLGFISCIDLTSGTERWRVDEMCGQRLTLAADEHVERPLLVSQQGAHVVALDAQSGRKVWRCDLGRADTGTTCYARGVVYHSRGVWLYALDAATGRTLATTESPSGAGLSVWSDGVRVYWSTEWGVQIYEAAPRD